VHVDAIQRNLLGVLQVLHLRLLRCHAPVNQKQQI
jgi:hypothetical protein